MMASGSTPVTNCNSRAVKPRGVYATLRRVEHASFDVPPSRSGPAPVARSVADRSLTAKMFEGSVGRVRNQPVNRTTSPEAKTALHFTAFRIRLNTGASPSHVNFFYSAAGEELDGG